jgi:hypothetical protein
LVQTKVGVARTSTPDQAEQALIWAEDHLFNRRSVVREHELWRHALEHARGENWTMAELKQESQNRNYIRNEDKPGNVTTREMLLREYQIVSLAHDGISRFWPLAPDFIPTGLADDQKQAVERILNSRNFVTLFRGGCAPASRSQKSRRRRRFRHVCDVFTTPTTHMRISLWLWRWSVFRQHLELTRTRFLCHLNDILRRIREHHFLRHRG